MDERQIEKDIAILLEKNKWMEKKLEEIASAANEQSKEFKSDFKDQVRREEADKQSEQRHRDDLRAFVMQATQNNSERFGNITHQVENNIEKIKNHDEVLYNKGEGLVYKVKEFDKSIDDITKDSKEWVKTYNDVFYNKDHGVVYKVKEFDKRIQNNSSVWNKIAVWAGVIISAIALFIVFTK